MVDNGLAGACPCSAFACAARAGHTLSGMLAEHVPHRCVRVCGLRALLYHCLPGHPLLTGYDPQLVAGTADHRLHQVGVQRRGIVAQTDGVAVACIGCVRLSVWGFVVLHWPRVIVLAVCLVGHGSSGRGCDYIPASCWKGSHRGTGRKTPSGLRGNMRGRVLLPRSQRIVAAR